MENDSVALIVMCDFYHLVYWYAGISTHKTVIISSKCNLILCLIFNYVFTWIPMCLPAIFYLVYSLALSFLGDINSYIVCIGFIQKTVWCCNGINVTGKIVFIVHFIFFWFNKGNTIPIVFVQFSGFKNYF